MRHALDHRLLLLYLMQPPHLYCLLLLSHLHLWLHVVPADPAALEQVVHVASEALEHSQVPQVQGRKAAIVHVATAGFPPFFADGAGGWPER